MNGSAWIEAAFASMALARAGNRARSNSE